MVKSRNEIKVHFDLWFIWSIYSLKIYLHTHCQYAWAEAPGHILRSPPFSLFSLGSPAQPSPVMIRQCPAAVIGYYEGGGGEEVSGGFGQNGRNSVLTYSLGNAVSASSNEIVIYNILAI